MVIPVRSCLALLLVIAGTADAGPPIAALATDIDGDKSSDKVELDDAGTLTVQTRRGSAKVVLGLKAQHATVASAIVRGTPTLVVKTETEGIVVQAAGAMWKTLVRSPIGGVGLDADYRVALEAGDAGIVRYQTRFGFARCDGKPAYLFPEVYEGGAWQPLAKLPIG